jgi:hypothetical protein
MQQRRSKLGSWWQSMPKVARKNMEKVIQCRRWHSSHPATETERWASAVRDGHDYSQCRGRNERRLEQSPAPPGARGVALLTAVAARRLLRYWYRTAGERKERGAKSACYCPPGRRRMVAARRASIPTPASTLLVYRSPPVRVSC